MRRGIMVIAMLLAGCATADNALLEPESDVALTVPTESCEGSLEDRCRFYNTPVKLSSRPIKLPDNPYPFYKTRNRLEFVDAKEEAWIAPAGILTDGASIPPIFVPFIGDPMSKEFFNAAVVHDSYSAESNKNTPYYHTAPWQDVHRMFYDGLRASGTPPLKAKIMYAAVYLGGPRWSEVRPAPNRRAAVENALQVIPVAVRNARDLQSNEPLTRQFTKEQLIAAFKKARDYIRSRNPSIAEVEIYLTRLELEMRNNTATKPAKKRSNFKSTPITPRNTNEFGGDGDGGDGGGEAQ